MALFRNLGVKLRVSLCDVLSYLFAQPLVFLDLAENCSFLNWKPAVPTSSFMDGHYLNKERMRKPLWWFRMRSFVLAIKRNLR